jgi:hypothetical protein
MQISIILLHSYTWDFELPSKFVAAFAFGEIDHFIENENVYLTQNYFVCAL